MKRILITILIILSYYTINAQFVNYFENKTLRIDYKHGGNRNFDTIWLDEFVDKPCEWGGSTTQLIDPLNYGSQRVRVTDATTKKEIYTRTYSTLFKEWRMTHMAVDSFMTFEECVLIPFPKKPVNIEIQSRKNNTFETRNSFYFNPKKTELSTTPPNNYTIKKLLYNGTPHKKVDFVIVPDGYSLSDSTKLEKDLLLFKNAIIQHSPFSENASNINIWGILAFSDSSGITNPRRNIFKSTVAGSTFNAFEIDRYIMTFELKKLHNAIANVPYDQIIIMSNTNTYGGGAIYNYYANITTTQMYSRIIPHELGHSFGNLGDEYEDNTISYLDLYLSNYEPDEPNLTNLANFESKWKNMINKDTPTPTPSSKKYENVVGLFEGGGYVSKGIYRPYYNCAMRSGSEMCPVCKKAINSMFNLYTK